MKKLFFPYLLVIFCIYFLNIFNSFSQNSDFDKIREKALFSQAKKNFNNGEFDQAREKLNALVKRNPERFIYHYELGLNCYYYSPEKESAIPHFENALRTSPKDTVGEIFFYLGNLYQHQGELEKAIEFYTSMKRFVKGSKEGKELLNDINYKIAQCQEGKAFAVSVDNKIKIENLGINVNSRYSEYSPVVSNDQNILMFTSRRTETSGGKRDFRDDKYFEDMYLSRRSESGFGPAESFLISDRYVGLIPNSPEHDAVVSLSNDEKNLFTFRENSIWLSTLSNEGIWEGPVKLNDNINKSKSYQPHASISPDGNTLYFSSDRKGGKGGIDLYRSVLQQDGTWGEAENLGEEVNSKYDEDSPWISDDGKTLYFSSKGHNSMGGYDIFYSLFENGYWSKPVNLGHPINSPSDDVHYLPLKDGRQAYFASSRPDGLGEMDIYRLTWYIGPEFSPCELIAGIVTDDPGAEDFVAFLPGDTVKPGEEVTFDASVSRVKDSEIKEYYWDFGNDKEYKGSKVIFKFEDEGEYEVKMEIESFHKKKFTTNNFCVSRKIFVAPDRKVEPVILADNNKTDKKEDASSPAKTKAETLPALNFEKIFYDYDKSNLRGDAKDALGKNLAVLKAYPAVKIEIIAHTDTKGSEEYNLRLSQKRAKAVSEFLVRNGISHKRIKIIGKGESEPLNRCVEGVDCSPEEHQQNRRSEFKIINE